MELDSSILPGSPGASAEARGTRCNPSRGSDYTLQCSPEALELFLRPSTPDGVSPISPYDRVARLRPSGSNFAEQVTQNDIGHPTRAGKDPAQGGRQPDDCDWASRWDSLTVTPHGPERRRRMCSSSPHAYACAGFDCGEEETSGGDSGGT